MSTIWSGSN